MRKFDEAILIAHLARSEGDDFMMKTMLSAAALFAETEADRNKLADFARPN